jgi:hypothetical protein
MAYAADLGGAFFCGEGPHAFVKPDGHYMDDLWFYDLNANRWICLYPGADVKNLRLKLDEHGFEVDAGGRFVPVACLGHAYNLTTYDSDLRKYLVIPLPGSWWSKALPARGEWLGIPPEDRGKAYQNGKLNTDVKHPILYDVTAGRWERRFVEGNGPGRRFEGVAEYLPGRKQTLCLLREGMWFYDHAANKWTGPQKAAANGYDSNACLDTKRGRLLTAAKEAFWAYDLAGNSWAQIKAEGQPAGLGCTNTATLTYDRAADTVVWLGASLAVYDPEKNSWKAGAPPPQMRGQLHGFYSPELNVHCWYVAGDGSDKGKALAYRCRDAKPPAPEGGRR